MQRDDPILFVAGLGRCGTTMVMTMLAAAGVPTAGTLPAFEDIPFRPRRTDEEWLRRQGGRAVKWIDPTQTRVPASLNACAVFLRRDPKEQARSQAKLLGANPSRAGMRALQSRVAADNRIALAMVRRVCGDHGVMLMTFEKILANPLDAAHRLAAVCDWAGLDFGDPETAARAVMPRSPECAPDLAIEARLLDRSK